MLIIDEKNNNKIIGEIRSQEVRSVLLVCAKAGCPRKMIIQFDERRMPRKTEKIKSNCPWHSSAGDFETELYFDKDGNQLERD